MRKIIVFYSAEEGKYNNRETADRLMYELAHQVLMRSSDNSIQSVESVTPQITRVKFKNTSEIILYPIQEKGLDGMKVTDIYVDNDIRNILSDARIFLLKYIMPSLLDDKMCKTLYNYDSPMEERLRSFRVDFQGDFIFENFMKNYEDL